MKRFVINGYNSKVGGGLSLLQGLIAYLSSTTWPHREFLIVVPDDEKAVQSLPAAQGAVRYARFDSALPRPVRDVMFHFVWLPALMKRENAVALLNFGDVIAPVRNQVYFFDWSYAVYPDSPVWRRMSARDWIARKLKAAIIKSLSGIPRMVIAQTEVIRGRLLKYTRAKSVQVIASPVYLPVKTDSTQTLRVAPRPGWKMLLCLSGYASHKNLEILVDVAELFRAHRLEILIAVTIDPSDGPEAWALDFRIKSKALQEYIALIGHLPKSEVRDQLLASSALILPTLLESFGLPYVEAMHLGKPVFTSDLDFARAVCGPNAFYFDPLDPTSIVSTIEGALADPAALAHRAEAARLGAQSMLSPDQAHAILLSCLEQCADHG